MTLERLCFELESWLQRAGFDEGAIAAASEVLTVTGYLELLEDSDGFGQDAFTNPDEALTMLPGVHTLAQRVLELRDQGVPDPVLLELVAAYVDMALGPANGVVDEQVDDSADETADDLHIGEVELTPQESVPTITTVTASGELVLDPRGVQR